MKHTKAPDSSFGPIKWARDGRKRHNIHIEKEREHMEPGEERPKSNLITNDRTADEGSVLCKYMMFGTRPVIASKLPR